MTFIAESAYVSTFVGDTNIPNLQAVTEKLTFFVEKIQEKMLLSGLGYALKTEVETNYDSEVDDKWKDLVEGSIFEVETYQIKWPGLIEMLRYFTYAAYIINPAADFTGSGSVHSEYENARYKSNNELYIDAWNKATDLYGVDVGLISGSNFILRGRDYQERYLNNERVYSRMYEKWKYKGTLSNFIYYKNKEDSTNYPDWIFTQLSEGNPKINIYGI